MAKHVKILGLALGVASVALSGCAQDSGETTVTPGSDGVEATRAAPSQDDLPAPKGPKKRVAVAGFGAHGKFTAQYGGWDVGGGLAAQLTTALVESDRFFVVERARLSEVLREQEMSAKGLTTPATAVQAGRVTGAQMLVQGEVTAFGQTQGGGVSVGTGGLIGDVGAGVGVERTVARVGMDIRLIDTTTGAVVQSHRVKGKATDTGVAAEISTDDVSFGSDAFQQTLLGEATREAIDKAVRLIAEEMQDVRWRARVAKVDGRQVYINVGRDSGLERGNRLIAERVADKITDPSTGEVLGFETRELGAVVVRQVEDKYSIGGFRGDGRPRRGDLLTFEGGS